MAEECNGIQVIMSGRSRWLLHDPLLQNANFLIPPRGKVLRERSPRNEKNHHQPIRVHSFGIWECLASPNFCLLSRVVGCDRFEHKKVGWDDKRDPSRFYV